jgi:predicted O-methyltransferase YrrM
MIYEIEIAFRTLRREGFASLVKKMRVYLRQLFHGARFMFLRLPSHATPEELWNFSAHTAGGLVGMSQEPSEILALAKLIEDRRPKTMVEIGTANGGTLFLWCRLAHPQATVVSIDLPGGLHGGGYPQWMSLIYRRFPSATQTLHLLRGDSHKPEMLTRLKSLLPGDGEVDFLFIDGDHTYDGVKADFEMYSGLVRPGGLIAFHDICKHPESANCQVDRFWREVKNERRAREFVHDPKQGTCGIGLIEV